ncbi:flagellar basal-body MS-ring/collar protein FliF [Oscillospiraceae bacterium 44-5]
MQTFQTKLKELWEKIKSFFKKLNKKVRILLGVFLVVLLAVIIAAAVLLNQKEYAVLYTGLNSTEISTVGSYLADRGVTDYQIQGDTILVPAGREVQLQAELAMSGYLTTGFNYEYLDNLSGISTEAERREALRIATIQKLEATIRQFNGVRNANVEIALGTQQVFVLQDSAIPATAAVTITPESDQGLDSAVVKAIRHTVSHSVQQLDISNVSIEDIYGNTYSDNDTIDKTNQATALKMEYEERISNNVRTQIRQTLDKIYGPENVAVSVLCTVDVTHQIIDSVTYNQPDGSVDGGGLIINDHLFYERIRDGETPTGGTVGTTPNSDLNGNFPNYPDWTQDGDENDTYVGNETDRTHAIDQTNTQEEVLEGRLKDLRVTVTVNQNCTNAGAMTIDSLRDNVATLVGIAGTEEALDRVFVAIAPFDTSNTVAGPEGPWFLSPENSWILYAAIGGLVLFVVLLIVILVLARRRRKKRLEEQQALEEEMMAAQAAAEAAAIIAAAPPTGGADIMEVNTEKSMELRKSVRQFAQNNPEIAAQMVKAWLKGDETGG